MNTTSKNKKLISVLEVLNVSIPLGGYSQKQKYKKNIPATVIAGMFLVCSGANRLIIDRTILFCILGASYALCAFDTIPEVEYDIHKWD